MAQIIKHRRGSLEALSAVTASLQKGELVIASGSSNLSVNNGSSLVFAAVENGQVQAVNRFLTGDSAPNNFAGSTYNGLVKGVPYYASGSSTLYLLGTDSNEAINLVGNIQPFSASVASSINSLSASIGSGTIGNSVTLLNSFTGSQETKNSTLASYTASVDSRLSQLEADSGSQDGRLDTLESKAGTLSTYTASVDVHISNVNAFTASQEGKDLTLSSYTASINSHVSSVNTFTSSASGRLTNLESYTSSNDTTNTAQNNRLTSLESVTGSYAKLSGGNVFTGTQTISGSMYITNDLIVYGSSSLQNITASAASLGTNTIILNTADPAFRFGGVSVVDSGSQQNTGSLFWDSEREHWVYERSDITSYGSAILISGPKNTGSLGDESGLSVGFIPVATGDDHIDNSIISQSGGNKISIAGGLDVIGEISASSIVGIGSVASFSSSVDGRLDSLEGAIGGGINIDTRLTNLESFSGSEESKNLTLAAFSASVNSFTSSQETKNGTLESYTASVDVHISSVNSFTASANVSISNLNSFTSSQESKNLTLAAFSASVNSFTSSQETKNSTLASYTASIDSKFSTLATTTSSFASRLNQLETDSGSQDGRLDILESYTASADTKFLAIASSTASLNSFTASAAGRLSNIELFTSSFGTTFSSSVDSRLDALEGTGTIQGVGTTNDVTFNSLNTAGNVTVGGDLIVQGNTVTLNTSQLVIEDKLITLASGSTNNTTADGAGFEIDGTTASFKYDGTLNQFSSSIHIAATVTGSVNLGASAGNTKRIAFRNTNGNLDLVPTASVAGDLVQWNGSDFVMSNIIDGGSF